MSRFREVRPVLFAASLVLAACARSEQVRQAEEAARQLEEAGRKMGEAIGGAAGAAAGAAVTAGVKAEEPVDFRALKDLLPEDLPGMKRTSAEGEKAGAMGFVASNAEGRYQAEGGGNITVKITDVGAMTGIGALAAFAWATAEIDRETENGYERTTTQKGYKGYEKYDRSSKSGEVSLLVANRFVVGIDGYDISMDQLKAALDRIDLGKLEGMKNVGMK